MMNLQNTIDISMIELKFESSTCLWLSLYARDLSKLTKDDYDYIVTNFNWFKKFPGKEKNLSNIIDRLKVPTPIRLMHFCINIKPINTKKYVSPYSIKIAAGKGFRDEKNHITVKNPLRFVRILCKRLVYEMNYKYSLELYDWLGRNDQESK